MAQFRTNWTNLPILRTDDFSLPRIERAITPLRPTASWMLLNAI